MRNNLSSLYKEDYFSMRNGNDRQRRESFYQEKSFIEKYSSLNEIVLDVGCSTGEFLENIKWAGMKYGIEISDEAAKKASDRGIEMVSDYSVENSLDVVIYRGTIQHLDSPFRSLEKAAQTLKVGGKLFIIATPNINSLYYRIFRTLPALDKERNFYLPSDLSLVNICKIYKLDLISVEYPYIKSPYSRPFYDFYNFMLKLLLSIFNRGNNIETPFYKNMMNMVFEKKAENDT